MLGLWSEVPRRRAFEIAADAATLIVTEVEDLPLAYLPGDARRVRVRVVGDTRPGGAGDRS